MGRKKRLKTAKSLPVQSVGTHAERKRAKTPRAKQAKRHRADQPLAKSPGGSLAASKKSKRSKTPRKKPKIGANDHIP